MDDNKRLDKSSRSILENSQYLYSDNANKEGNDDYLKFQQELENYENQSLKSNNNNNNLYHFKYSGQFDELQKSQSNINGDNISNYTFGSQKQNLSSSNQFNINKFFRE